ncbi:MULTISPECIES: nitrate reductase molybdenum cofactor assembly chaperone [Bordetella]|uniref:Nitrate reductase molybdenum cofactor assembly chaperone n=2 Tax=Bordetella TaxID=517 RepID=A0A261V7P4_9BORD|nr:MULTISPECIES: nitrate reductase molybdenum cofactor assembly chaperone [Bordetella]MDM9561734.1 nitrate reductase molybdenum cofactor assembly chaperone [Bordetella petrii]OZI69821.1 nitrate reductase molybdenum cofactor assembly chaperone [Bordetella genomosp. 2]
MSLYRILSALLSYPEQDLLDALLEIDDGLDAYPEAQDLLAPLTDYLKTHDLIALQENYVATFDRNPSHSLHLFEHVHGESRDRGQAMVDLLQEYRRHGFEPGAAELPDYVPLFLELLGLIDPGQARQLLDEAIHVLAAIGARLARHGSPYSTIFAVLRGMTDVVPREQTEPPVRDMDEVMEAYGVGADGVEPLLPHASAGTQVVHFHPRARSAH